ncbi:oxygenase MpaB family protein [Nocardia salmonicida]|uniref:oxygenase MpaB family protein n=1 Tax=Nocardia salmonicida TaxID=53431 RepID=UPI0007A46D6A|nr:oxygenase MpaB family protein [Nocardia salmonicida]
MSNHNDVVPHQDYGFFGPDSVAWRVFRYPTTLSVAFQRTAVTEMFEPFLMASVADTGAVLNRPDIRFDRTLQYMATLVFGDTASVLKASQVLVRIHTKITGIEPISGLRYDANDPDAQLWIHLTAWHSVLYCYEKFGPGPLSEDDDLRYWAECARAAQFQTIDPAAVPHSREQMRAYYARMKPVLAARVVTQEHVDHLLDGARLMVPRRRGMRPLAEVNRVLFRAATIATLPRWMRTMAGIRQNAVTDAAITAVMRVLFGALDRSVSAQRFIVATNSPHTAPVVDPILCDVAPKNPVVRTPEQARAEFGVPTPAEQYAAIRTARGAAELPDHADRDGAEPLLSFQ